MDPEEEAAVEGEDVVNARVEEGGVVVKAGKAFEAARVEGRKEVKDREMRTTTTTKILALLETEMTGESAETGPMVSFSLLTLFA